MPLTWIFLILSTVLLEWLMLSLFVAVVTGTFERVREMDRGKVKGARCKQAAGVL